MSSILVGHNGRLLMLDFLVDKLYIKYDDPMESILKSYTVLSYSFYADEWFEFTPNRIDYRKYWGDNDETKEFHGGQSVVFSVPNKTLEDGIERVFLDVKARREFADHYFQRPPVKEAGCTTINISELFEAICKELRIRRELGDFLKLPHERDPITSTMKDRHTLYDPKTKKATSSYIDLFLRVSYLGDSVITEIDRIYPKRLEVFFAQEDCNLTKPYECRELEEPVAPQSKLDPLTFTRDCELVCECTDVDRLRMLCAKDECVETEDIPKVKKKKKKKTRDGSTTMEIPMVDKSTTSEPLPEPEKKPKEEYANLIKELKGKRRGSGPLIYIPKDVPCEPVCCCLPCNPCCPPSYDPCCPTPYCPPPVCCLE